ncbi:MAG: single-stranded DNA-binding protein [Brachybacterium sp.]
MANDTLITVIGNLTAAPEVRFTQAGLAVANFTVASTPRKFNRQTNEWEEQEALFLRCSVWREYAENVAGSLTKGMNVIVQGNLRQRSYDDKEGNKRTSVELEVTEVGPALRFAVAQVQKSGGRSGGQQAPQAQAQYGAPQQQGGAQYGPPQGQPQYGAPQQAPPQQQPQGVPAPQQQPQAYPAPQQAPAQQPPQQAPQSGGFDQNPAFSQEAPF